MNNVEFKTRKSVYNEVIELLEKGILIRSSNSKKYWVNPIVIFNSNRITFINDYILIQGTEIDN